MKTVFIGIVGLILTVAIMTLVSCNAEAAIKRIGGYYRSNGTYVQSHYRDTSNDGNAYNNANYYGWNN